MMKKYLFLRARLLYLFCLLLVLYGLFFFLYDLAVEGFLYGGLLGCVFLCGFMIWDYIHYVNHVRQLRQFSRLLTVEPFKSIGFQDLYEAEYAQLLNQLFEMYQHLENESINQKERMMNYYSMWVHQIKTPISAMHLMLQNQSTEDLAFTNELFKIEQYVEMVLSYLRLDSDETDYHFANIQIDRVIRDSIRKYSRLFIQKRLTLSFADTEFVWLTDEKWLAFAFEQILSNAIKYTNSGGIRIYGKEQALYIEDDGMGISAEDLPRIFEKGFTGYNGRNDKKASGIGLFLTKQVLTRLAIKIEVHSTPGIGTCVTLQPDVLNIEIE